MNIKHSHLLFKYKSYITFSKSKEWEYLKSDLLRIKEREALSESEPQSEFESIKRDIKRANTIKIINEIIGLVEKAEGKIGKKYE